MFFAADQSQRFFAGLANLLWPTLCAGCDQQEVADRAFCPDCAATLDPASPCESTSAVLAYGGAITTALYRLKWTGRDDLARPLGMLLVPMLKEMLASCDVMIPIPLHRQRLLVRGYNQAALLAKEARCEAGWKGRLDYDGLFRQRPAAENLQRDRATRWASVANAFVVPMKARARLRGARILLIDDVTTTGATIHAAKEALLVAGASSASALVLARA